MHLIEAVPVPTPADGERLLADLWQLTSGRALGLYMLGLRGNGVTLGVHCHEPYLEELAASTISDHIGGQIEPGWTVAEMIEVSDERSIVNMVPTDRNLSLNSTTFGWQRTDPLRGAYNALANIPQGSIAGTGITLRALPDFRFVVSMAAFAAGPGSGPISVRVASSFAGVGVRLRRPFRQNRAIKRTLEAQMRRPQSIKRLEEVSSYWHPPYGSDLTNLPGLAQPAENPAGLLH